MVCTVNPKPLGPRLIDIGGFNFCMKGITSRHGELSLEDAVEDERFSKEQDSSEIENFGKIGRIVVFLLR